MAMIFDIQYVWRCISDSLRDEAAQFWMSVGAVQDLEQARLRADHLLVVVRNPEGRIVALSTAFKDVVRTLGFSVYSVQMYIERPYRRYGLAQRILVAGWRGLNALYKAGEAQDALAVLIELGTDKLMRANRHAVWRWYGMEFVYTGKSARGGHLRVWYFDDAKVPV